MTKRVTGGQHNHTLAVGLRSTNPLGHLRQSTRQVTLLGLRVDVVSEQSQCAATANDQLRLRKMRPRCAAQTDDAVIEHTDDVAFGDQVCRGVCYWFCCIKTQEASAIL